MRKITGFKSTTDLPRNHRLSGKVSDSSGTSEGDHQHQEASFVSNVCPTTTLTGPRFAPNVSLSPWKPGTCGKGVGVVQPRRSFKRGPSDGVKATGRNEAAPPSPKTRADSRGTKWLP